MDAVSPGKLGSRAGKRAQLQPELWSHSPTSWVPTEESWGCAHREPENQRTPENTQGEARGPQGWCSHPGARALPSYLSEGKRHDRRGLAIACDT